MTRVLITGGAGFIGSHTSDLLLEAGYQVRLLDNLMPQVHGPSRQPPVYLNPGAELTVGDVTDHAALDRALRGVDLVLHLASTVGVGQSMYDMVSYVRNNEVGTATLLEALAKRPVARIAERSGDVRERRERRFDDQAAGGNSRSGLCGLGAQMSSEVYRDGPTERMAINEALGGIRLELRKTLPCDMSVFIDRILGGQAALAQFGLCPEQVCSGATLSDGREILRDSHRGTSFL